MALIWLRLVDGVPLSLRDLIGGSVVLTGMAVLIAQGHEPARLMASGPAWEASVRIGELSRLAGVSLESLR